MNTENIISLEIVLENYANCSPGHNTPSGSILEWLRETAQKLDLQSLALGCGRICQKCSGNWPFILNSIPAIMVNHFFNIYLNTEEYQKFIKIYNSDMSEEIKKSMQNYEELNSCIQKIKERCR